jgi:hypothetical protein
MPTLLVVQIGILMVQRWHKPRFWCLRYLFGKPHQYLVKISKVKEALGDDHLCPICYGELDYFGAGNMTVAKGNRSRDDAYNGFETMKSSDLEKEQKAPILGKPMNKCMATPCKHFYHEKCLKEWMDLKMECPTCRAVLPPY